MLTCMILLGLHIGTVTNTAGVSSARVISISISAVGIVSCRLSELSHAKGDGSRHSVDSHAYLARGPKMCGMNFYKLSVLSNRFVVGNIGLTKRYGN